MLPPMSAIFCLKSADCDTRLACSRHVDGISLAHGTRFGVDAAFQQTHLVAVPGGLDTNGSIEIRAAPLRIQLMRWPS